MVASESNLEEIWIVLALPLFWFLGYGDWEVSLSKSGWVWRVFDWKSFGSCHFLEKVSRIQEQKRGKKVFKEKERERERERKKERKVSLKTSFTVSLYIAWA